MIPLRDNIRSKNYPVINTTIIVLNVFVFFIQLAQGQDLTRFIHTYGLVPARYSIPSISSYFTLGQQLFPFLSFMFLHGGFIHLLGNMWSLYIFGDNVEDKLGPFRYILFYLLCGRISSVLSGISSSTFCVGLPPVPPIWLSTGTLRCQPSGPVGPLQA